MFLSTSQIFTQKKPFFLKIAKIDNTYHKNMYFCENINRYEEICDKRRPPIRQWRT